MLGEIRMNQLGVDMARDTDYSTIQKIDVNAGDIVLIRPSVMLGFEENKKIEQTWTEMFKQQGYKNVKVIVTNVGIEVIGKESK
jgi:hypothetical protein